MPDCKRCLPDRPDVKELRDRIANEMSARLFNGAPVIRGSNEDVVAGMLAGLMFEAHGWVQAAMHETDPACMCCDSLHEFARRRGIYPLPARPAKGYVKITGVAGTTVPTPISFADASGRTYIIDPTWPVNPIVLDASGEAIIRVIADYPGPDYNLEAGVTIYITSPPPGVDTDATVVGDGLVGGADEESCNELRERVLERLKTGAVSANVEWIMAKMRDFPGVTRVCSSTCDCAIPSFYVFMDGVYEPYGIPPVEILDEISDMVFGYPPGVGYGSAPVGARGIVKQAIAEPITINVRGMAPNTSVVRGEVASLLSEVLSQHTCPGGCMCLRWFDDAIAGLPSVDCYSRIEIIPGAHSRIDGDNLCLDCDYFPVVDGVNFL